MMEPAGTHRDMHYLASSAEINEIRERLFNTTFKVVRRSESELGVEFLQQPSPENSNIEIRFSAEENTLGTRQVNISFHRINPATPLQILQDLRILLDNNRQPVTNKNRDTFSFKSIKLDTEYRFVDVPQDNQGDGRGDVPRPVVPPSGPSTLSGSNAVLPPSGLYAAEPPPGAPVARR